MIKETKYPLILINSFFLISCGSSKSRGINIVSPSRGLQNIPSAANIEKINGNTSTNNKVLIHNAPVALLLTADDVKASLKPVFGAYVADNVESFDANEKFQMGSIFPRNSEDFLKGFSLRTINFQRKAEPDRDYLFTLRKFLGSSCKAAVDKEIVKRDDPANKVVSVIPVTTAAVNKTMGYFFGYATKNSTLHRGAEEYASAINTIIAEQKLTKDEELKDVFIQYCISIGTDPRTFTR